MLAGGQFPQIAPDDLGIAADARAGRQARRLGRWGLTCGSSIPAMTCARAASWDFITYLTAAEQQSEWSSATGYLPVRTDALTLDPLQTTWTTDPRFKVPYDQLLSAPDVPTSVGPILGPLREVRTVTAQGVAAIFGGADVAATLAASAAQADALIADYNSRNG